MLFPTSSEVPPDPTDTGAGVRTVRRVNNKQGALTLIEKHRHLVWLPIADVLADPGIDRGTLDKRRKRGVGPRMKLLPNRTWRIRGAGTTPVRPGRLLLRSATAYSSGMSPDPTAASTQRSGCPMRNAKRDGRRSA